MSLEKLINTLDSENKLVARKIIASAIGVSESTVRSMANGNRRITAERAKQIVRAFPAIITESELRPDIFG